MCSLGGRVTPGEQGVDMSGECACRCLRYVLVEVYGKCGPESTWNPTMWGADRGQEERHTRAGPTSLCWPMRKKNVKPTSPGKYTAQGPGWGPPTRFTLQRRQPWVLWRSLSLPLGCNGCLDWGSKAPAAHGKGCWGPSPWEKRSSIWGWGGAFPLESPGPPPPVEKTQTNSSVGGEGGRAPQTLLGRPGTQDENRAPRTEGRRRVQQHQSHSEHNTMGRTGVGGREEIVTKPGRTCPGLPAPQGCGAGFGQLGESLSSSWGSGLGRGGGRAGGGWGEGVQTRLWRRGATRTTPSWK